MTANRCPECFNQVDYCICKDPEEALAEAVDDAMASVPAEALDIPPGAVMIPHRSVFATLTVYVWCEGQQMYHPHVIPLAVDTQEDGSATVIGPTFTGVLDPLT